MRQILYCTLFFAATACAPIGNYRSTSDAAVRETNIVRNNDQQEYELIIIDPGYNQWKVTNARPVWFYSKAYYENWNQIYVQAWNEKVSQAVYYSSANYPFENRIEYNPNIDYGLALNYELFTYFKYVESQFGAQYGFRGLAS